MTVRTSSALRNSALTGDNIAEKLDGLSGSATIEVYTGTVNGTFGLAPGGTKLATLTLARPSFQTASAGSMTANTIGSDVYADGTGSMGCFVVKDTSGVIQLDGSITATGSGGDLQADSGDIAVTAGDVIACSSLAISIPQS